MAALLKDLPESLQVQVLLSALIAYISSNDLDAAHELAEFTQGVLNFFDMVGEPPTYEQVVIQNLASKQKDISN